MIQGWLLLWLVLSSAVAYRWPQPWLASKPGLPWMIAGIMFCIGLMLSQREVREVGRHWPAVIGGVALQYTLMPALALAIGSLWGLSGPALAGMMIVGCVPGAMASNVLTLNAKGHTSFSVSLTATATLLSPIVTPLALSLTLRLSSDQAGNSFSGWSSSVTLLQTVVAPVILGFACQRIFPKIEPFARRFCPNIANFLILWVIAIVVAINRESLGQASSRILLPLLLLNLLGYAGGYLGGWLMRLPESMRRALTIEVGMQNAGVGAVLALKLFGDRAALAPALYTFGCMLTGVILAIAWSKRPPGKNSAGQEPKPQPS